MKKKIISLILSCCLLCMSCSNPFPVKTTPECGWTTGAWYAFQSVHLTMPDGLSFKPSVSEFTSFHDIFILAPPVNNSSKITITTKVDGCAGTTSKSTTYSTDNFQEIWNTQFTNQNQANVDNSNHQVTIELTSGTWRNAYGQTGVIVWSTNLGAKPLLSNQPSLNQIGTFKITQSKVSQRVYIGDGFESEVL